MKYILYMVSVLGCTNAVGQPIQKSLDSLYGDCVNRVLYLCKDTITNDQNFRQKLILEDEVFFKKIDAAFRNHISHHRAKKKFRKKNFITRTETRDIGGYKIYEAMFYTHYTSGHIYFAYRNDSLKYKGCLIHTSYRQFCKDNRDFPLSTLDFPFFRKHVFPFFSSYRIKEACWHFAVEDGRELSWAFIQGSKKYLEEIR